LTEQTVIRSRNAGAGGTADQVYFIEEAVIFNTELYAIQLLEHTIVQRRRTDAAAGESQDHKQLFRIICTQGSVIKPIADRVVDL